MVLNSSMVHSGDVVLLRRLTHSAYVALSTERIRLDIMALAFRMTRSTDLGSLPGYDSLTLSGALSTDWLKQHVRVSAGCPTYPATPTRGRAHAYAYRARYGY